MVQGNTCTSKLVLSVQREKLCFWFHDFFFINSIYINCCCLFSPFFADIWSSCIWNDSWSTMLMNLIMFALPCVAYTYGLSIDINYSMGSLLWCLKICVPCHNTWQKESMINWYLDYFSSILEENILNASNRSSYINSYYKAMNLLMLGQEQLWRVHNKILIMYEHI